MILSDKDIKKCMASGDIEIDPFDASNLKPGSYTLTLAKRFYVLKDAPFIDSREEKIDYAIHEMGEEGYLLNPGEFIICLSAERIRLSSTLCCILSTRGSRAQMGLDVIQSSSFVEPGSNNQMALEISCSGTIPVKLFPGIKVAKAIFLPLSSSPDSEDGAAPFVKRSGV